MSDDDVVLAGWTLPAVTDITRAWFTSGTLAVQTCRSCTQRQHPPEEVCHRCGSGSFDYVALGPTGVVHSFTAVDYPVHPKLASSVPYVVVLVALDDDPTIRVVGNLLSVAPADVRIGQPLRAVWIRLADDDGEVLLPQWTAS